MNDPGLLRGLSDADSAVFASARREIDAALDRAIPGREPVALLVYPYDFNVGNHMMWLAAMDYLRERGLRVAYADCHAHADTPSLRRAVGSGPILFLGGVSISRLWSNNSDIRRRLALEFRQNHLISLPATIILIDDEDRRRASEMFRDHPSVTVMARDGRSVEQGRSSLSPQVRVVTVPDMALRLPPQPRGPAAPRGSILWLGRDDVEATGAPAPAGVQVVDWPPIEAVPGFQVLMRAGSALSRLRRKTAKANRLVNDAIVSIYRQASRLALAYGNRMLDVGRVLVTDRLHPHILAALRGQHVVLLPDVFGKNRAVYEAGTSKFSTVHWADHPEEALRMARELAG